MLTHVLRNGVRVPVHVRVGGRAVAVVAPLGTVPMAVGSVGTGNGTGAGQTTDTLPDGVLVLPDGSWLTLPDGSVLTLPTEPVPDNAVMLPGDFYLVLPGDLVLTLAV